MKLTTEQKAERDSVNAFMKAIASEADESPLNVHEVAAVHHGNFCASMNLMESDIMSGAMARGIEGIVTLTPHLFIGSGMCLGWILGREYERRMRDADALERMFGSEEKPAKPARKRTRKVD